MVDKSWLGWLAICGVILVFLSVNAWLFSLWRNRGSSKPGVSLNRTTQFLKDPWYKENQQLIELSKRVLKIKEATHPDETGNSPSPQDDQ
ncbi:MAG TPA: hypothetical protein VIO61_08000 [Anaerolineaceae bacterium]